MIDLTRSLPGAHATQLLCDFGAEVVLVEPTGGSPLRASPAWPFLARGKRSVVCDLHSPAGLARAADLIDGSDIVVESFRPGVAEALGLGPADALGRNPSLIYCSITGFGATGPLAQLKGYEALVMARIGALDALSAMADRPGPAFAAMPYCSFSAGQLAAQGVLSALFDRLRTGAGQHVSTSLLQGIAGHDIWNWFLRVLTSRYPDAFTPAPHVADGVPNSALVFRLLVALTSDGHWLQFSQTAHHLFVALMKELGLGWMFDDPGWPELPLVPDPARRVALWDMMLDRARERDLAGRRKAFAAAPDVWAEEFRSGPSVLNHPQLVHDGNVVWVPDEAGHGVPQPGPLAALHATPAHVSRRPPTIGEHQDMAAERPSTPPTLPEPGSSSPPLAGVTILELGQFYAAPFAATMLAELGARVIKVEPLDGDPLRSLASFPEVGAIKALQGKESVAIDLGTGEGRRLVRELAGRADIVLQSYRAGVAERLGLDPPALCASNPDLIVVSAGGYGRGGPCGGRPAFAPTIAAASGIAARLAGPALPHDPSTLDREGEKEAAVRLIAATNSAFAQADGLAALGNATAILLALVARARGHGGQQVETSMLLTAVHANCEAVVGDGRAVGVQPGADLTGFSALYRLYECADRRWIMLAAPDEKDWDGLVRALAGETDLGVDRRFETGPARSEHDVELAETLAGAFGRLAASAAAARITAEDVGCVVVADGPVEGVLLDDVGPKAGLVTEVEHPMLGAHPRLTPLVSLSRSSTRAGSGCLLGQHTDSVLFELGQTAEEVADLRRLGVVA